MSSIFLRVWEYCGVNIESFVNYLNLLPVLSPIVFFSYRLLPVSRITDNHVEDNMMTSLDNNQENIEPDNRKELEVNNFI